ncbi:MAG: hypothetical protein ABI758_07100, partial [Candidatus Woesebacteria bacterium]
LDQKYHQSLIQSFYWYSEAIKEIGVDHQLFYIKMVSAVEALSKLTPIPPDGLELKLNELMANNFTSEEQENIKSWLENRKIGKRFRQFLEQYSQGFFEPIPEIASHCYIPEADLDKYAKRIYSARSKYLHEGRPMYLSFDMTADEARNWDIDPTLGELTDRREIPGNEKLPRTRWFERTVNYCLKNFLNIYSKNAERYHQITQEDLESLGISGHVE